VLKVQLNTNEPLHCQLMPILAPPAADWKRPSGRPRRTWLQQVEEDSGLSVGLAQITSQDRSLWRLLRVRHSAGQAQQ